MPARGSRFDLWPRSGLRLCLIAKKDPKNPTEDLIKETLVMSKKRGKMNVTILGCDFCHACGHAFQHKAKKLDSAGKCIKMVERLEQANRRKRPQ